MSKVIKKAAPIVGAVGGNFLLPGIGGAIGGALGGAASGGGLKAALIGGATGGLGGAVGTGALGGLTGAGATAAQGAIYGAGAGGIDGGLKGALTGAALGGLGGYAAGGGLGSLGGTTGGLKSSLLGGFTPLPGGGAIPTQGILGAAGKFAPGVGSGLSGIGSALTSGGGNSVFSLGNLLKTGAGLYSSGQTKDAYKNMQRQLLAAQGQAQDVIQPFADTGLQAQQQLSGRLTEGFQPGDLTQDPGYQFRLQQGNQALERSLAAQGLGQSGAALKAAQEYGQGLADQTYGDAYQRWLAQNQQFGGLASQGQQAAGSLGNILLGRGDVNASATAALQDERNRSLASILSGSGFAGIY